jgi:hypothetical protein
MVWVPPTPKDVMSRWSSHMAMKKGTPWMQQYRLYDHMDQCIDTKIMPMLPGSDVHVPWNTTMEMQVVEKDCNATI